MPKLRLNSERLNRIGKADKKLLQSWKEGASLSTDSGQTIDSLKLTVATARWRLAAAHRRDGNKLLRLAQPPFRSAISRFYYAMYHSLRAAAFIFHEGDDYEEHSKLPMNLPSDFPDGGTWQNALKNARLSRNAADYDPYPTALSFWKCKATAIKTDTDLLLLQTKKYLITNGCIGLK